MKRPPGAQNSAFYELTLACLALLSVSIGIYDFLVPRTEPGFTWVDWLDLGIVAVFIIDFGVEAARRGSLRRYARENWWEIPSLIPVTGAMITSLQGYSVIRALRLVRLIRFLRALRVIGVAARLRETLQFALRIGRRAGLVKLFGFAFFTVGIGAVAGYLAERHVGQDLANFEDAIWWALNMFTNVAYVDFQPATTLGRIIAGFLEFLGIGFVGVFAGSVANALVRDAEAPGPAVKPTPARGSTGRGKRGRA